MTHGLVKKIRVFGKATLSRWITRKVVNVHGLSIEGAFQDYGLLNGLAKGHREVYMTDLFLGCLESTHSFWDVGAHLGVYSLLAARKIQGPILAFEPNPRTFSYLERNVQNNQLSERITSRQLALASREGQVQFFCDEFESDISSLIQLEAPKRLKTLDVSTTTLDQLVLDTPYLPQLMKIDVEGAELDVLRGGEMFWQRIRAGGPFSLFIESNASALKRAGTSPRMLYKELLSRGFKVAMIDEDQGCLVAIDERLETGCWNLFCELLPQS